MSVQEAPDSASALAAAKRQQSPVRVADLTTETRLVQATPDGHMAAEMTTVPVRDPAAARSIYLGALAIFDELRHPDAAIVRSKLATL